MGQKRSANDDYDSDGGFVEDAPRSKKSKASSKSTALSLEREVDAEGDVYWTISHNRRVTISSFKGTTMVSFREYYEKDGKMLPGKKGISLTLEQFDAVVELFPQLEQELSAKGHTIPSFAAAASTEQKEESATSKADEQDDDGGGTINRPKKVAARKNHEETSDEDD